MLKSTVLSALLALSTLATLAPAYAETASIPPATTPGFISGKAHGTQSVSGLTGAELAQLAGSAGVTVPEAKGMTLSQLYYLKESRDTDRPDVWKGQQPVTY